MNEFTEKEITMNSTPTQAANECVIKEHLLSTDIESVLLEYESDTGHATTHEDGTRLASWLAPLHLMSNNHPDDTLMISLPSALVWDSVNRKDQTKLVDAMMDQLRDAQGKLPATEQDLRASAADYAAKQVEIWSQTPSILLWLLKKYDPDHQATYLRMNGCGFL